MPRKYAGALFFDGILASSFFREVHGEKLTKRQNSQMKIFFRSSIWLGLRLS
jgi:hypothetical protein